MSIEPRTRLALVLGCVGLVGSGERPVFEPATGTTLVRTIEDRYEVALDSVRVSLNDEEVPSEALGEVHMDLTHHARVVVRDVIEGVADGRPTRVRRTFDELGGKDHLRMAMGGEESTNDSDYESGLEGKSVLFAWDEEQAAHVASFAAGTECGDALLEDLEEDLDLRALLPGREVAVGESWTIDAQAFHSILEPGGDLKLQDEDETDSGFADEQMRANLAGEFQATLSGIRSESDRRLAAIALAVDVRSFSEEEMGEDELDFGGSGSNRTEVRFVLEGELLWDLTHGHAESFELSGENQLTMTQTMRAEIEGEAVEQVHTMELNGTASFTMRCERQ
jgi:hypothetical protein